MNGLRRSLFRIRGQPIALQVIAQIDQRAPLGAKGKVSRLGCSKRCNPIQIDV